MQLNGLNTLLAPLVVVVLIFSFAFHAAQISHFHYEVAIASEAAAAHVHAPGEAHAHTEPTAELVPVANAHNGESLGHQMHMADEKLSIMVATVTLFALSFLIVPWRERLSVLDTLMRIRLKVASWPPSAPLSFFVVQFSMGKLNPKLH